MIAERSSYFIYMQRIEELTFQLQDINTNLETVDFIAHIKKIIPTSCLPSLQQLSLSTIVDHHFSDLYLIREKINRTIDLVLCQAPHLDPRIPEYGAAALQAERGGKHIFNSPVVLTPLRTVSTTSGKAIQNASEHLPGQETPPGKPSGTFPTFKEILPRKNFVVTEISHPEPFF